jgi:dihydropteroate synthase
MTDVHRRLRARDRVLELDARATGAARSAQPADGVRRSSPLLMGIVNASPDSFSDGGRYYGIEDQLALARKLVADGADILDIGGESAATGRPVLSAQEEIERVVPLIERIVAEQPVRGNAAPRVRGDAEPRVPGGVLVSVDTYKPAVAAAAIAAGAAIVNDVSGLRDPQLAALCARTGAALVVMHTRAAPKQRLQDPDLYGDVVEEVLAFLRERVELAVAAGVSREQLILDPGPDFAKTPAQTIALLGSTERLHELGRPLLMAISRKDFIGALTQRPPRGRAAGTLAALAHGLDAGAHIFRVHDVAAAADFLRVRGALRGEHTPQRTLALAEEHRHETHGPRATF